MASFSEYRARDWDDRRLILAAILSVLLHVLVALVFLLEPWNFMAKRDPPPLIAEFVMPEPPKPVPPTPPAPPAQAPTPPPPPQTANPELPPTPPVPQLGRGATIGEQSRSPSGAGERARQREERAEEKKPTPPQVDAIGPKPQARAPQAVPNRADSGNRRQGNASGSGGENAQEMTQSESDFFLSQIVNTWVLDFDAPRFANIRIYGKYRVLPNGMMAPPFGKNDPWDMRAMVDGWDLIANDPRPEAAAYRTALETFLRAMRLAQPLAMPPGAQGYPKNLGLDFRVGDL